MTGIDIDQVRFFDHRHPERTGGAWARVLRCCEPAPAPAEPLRVRIHQYLRRHPASIAVEVAAGLDLDSPAGWAAVRRTLLTMERDGEAVRHRGTDGRTANRWEAA